MMDETVPKDPRIDLIDLSPQVDEKSESGRSFPTVISFNASIDSLEELTHQVRNCYQPSQQFFGEDIDGIEVRILYTREEMDEALNHKTQSWVVGLACRNKTIVIFSPKIFSKVSPHPTSDFLPVLTHEIAHVFTGELFHLKYPRWLSEGLSGYVAEQYKTRASNVPVIQDFAEIHDMEGWNKTYPYNQAYSFTAYIIERFGKESLLSLLKSLAPNDSFQEFANKFVDAYKCDFDSCKIDWIKNLEVTRRQASFGIS